MSVTKHNVTTLKTRIKEILGVEANISGEQKDGSAASVKATVNGSVSIANLKKLDDGFPYTGSIRRSGKGLTITYK